MALGFDRPPLGTPVTTSLLSVVIKFFERNRWTYELDAGRSALVTRFRGSAGTWHCAAVVNQEEQQVAFFAQVETVTPEERRPAVIEYITRANFGLGMGNFEMDLSDGETRCKTCLSVQGASLTPALLDNLVRRNFELMDRYVPAMRKVISEELLPEAAITQAEQVPSA